MVGTSAPVSPRWHTRAANIALFLTRAPCEHAQPSALLLVSSMLCRCGRGSDGQVHAADVGASLGCQYDDRSANGQLGQQLYLEQTGFPVMPVRVEPAHFTLTESGEFAPTRFAQSHWGDDHLNGPAVVGLAARALELEYGSPVSCRRG